MKHVLLTLIIGFITTPSAFAITQESSHIDCPALGQVLHQDLVGNCSRLLSANLDPVIASFQNLFPHIDGKKDGKVTKLSCGYHVVYVCAKHMKDACDQAESNRIALMDGYIKATKSKSEDPQVYVDAIHKADTDVQVACNLKAPVRTAVKLSADQVVR